jgi:hypothetical protein
MKYIIFLLFSFNLFAAPNMQEQVNESPDRLKWLRAGYAVAKEHFRDYDIVGHIVAEECKEAEIWEPNRALGESLDIVPKSYKTITYYESFGLTQVHYRCTVPLTKGIGDVGQVR